MVTAHANLTVSWNTQQRPETQAQSALHGPVRTAVVAGVHGRHVVLRLPNGTMHVFSAAPQQALMLRNLVGHTIEFRRLP